MRALCLVILDVLVEVVREIYSTDSEQLIVAVQGVPDRIGARNTHKMISKIVKFSHAREFREIQFLLR
jgi:hypothetical protein